MAAKTESGVAKFERDGVRFRYPTNWRLEREEAETGWTVLVQSPETAFMMMTLSDEMTDMQEVSDTALEALRADYPDLEADDCVESLAGRPAVGHNIRFISLDLTNTCWTRSFYGSNATILVLCQLNDLELQKHEPVLRAICASVEVDDE